MSDFENLLQSPTFDIFVERLGEWMVGLLRKGVSVGWTELEGAQLLYAWTGKKVPTSSSLMARREFRFTQNGSLKGLKWAALAFEKDERTIRRWCEKKYFKSATQTPGRHWRIEPEEVERLRGKLRGRGPRRLFTTRVWKDFMKEGPASFLKLLGQATAMEAALQDGSQSALRSVPLVPSDQAFDALCHVPTKERKYSRLRFLARRLYLDNPTGLNYRGLAQALRINASTLYRRYGKEGIQSAIRAASKPFGQREAELKQLAVAVHPEDQEKGEEWLGEKDREALRETFNEIIVAPDTPSPYLMGYDPDTEPQ